MYEVQEATGSTMPWVFLSATLPVATTVTTLEGMKICGRPLDGINAECERDKRFFEVLPFSADN